MILKFPYKGDVYISSPYGYRILNGERVWHSGLDLVGKTSKTIVAPCDGTIGASTIITDKSNRTWEWGNYIRLDTKDGYSIFMCHMKQRLVSIGQKVKQGDPIGYEGSTGYSFGSHCHFEVRKNGVAVDPRPFFGVDIHAGLTYSNAVEDTEKDEDEVMTRDDVIKIIEEYEAAKKTQPCPKAIEEELEAAVRLGITDGSRPMQDCPRYQAAVMCKRTYEKLLTIIKNISK